MLPMTTITFPEDYNFDEGSIKFAQGAVGIYFIFLEELAIPYPFGMSRLIYIGLSESKQNSIGRRLHAHLTGRSGNQGIKNYVERFPAKFTFHSFQLLRNLGANDLYEIEAFFLTSFFNVKGIFPICNNQSGATFDQPSISQTEIIVDWEHFSKN
jgi:hypothetical protein